MDAPRFDALARAVTEGASRRRMLRGLAALAAGGLGARTGVVRADSSDDGIGGSDGTCVGVAGTCVSDANCVRGQVCSAGICRPRPTSDVGSQALEKSLPARIVGGTCAALDAITAFPLFEVGKDQGGGSGEAVGAESGIAVATSATTVRADLDALLADPHAIVIEAGADDNTAVACGDIGGRRLGKDLAIGLRERNGSGVSGIAWLRGDTNATLVYLFLAPGLGGGIGGSVPAGTTVVTTEDEVNLRAEPTTDSDVVAQLAKGTELTVTGFEENGWLPVKNPESGDSGYVAAQFLASTD